MKERLFIAVMTGTDFFFGRSTTLHLLHTEKCMTFRCLINEKLLWYRRTKTLHMIQFVVVSLIIFL